MRFISFLQKLAAEQAQKQAEEDELVRTSIEIH